MQNSFKISMHGPLRSNLGQCKIYEDKTRQTKHDTSSTMIPASDAAEIPPSDAANASGVQDRT
jgi:hypothetical protein